MNSSPISGFHGEAVSVMHAIKAIDPDNIMNPGKILRVLRFLRG
jgi:FAD/FMN-containing dehydrogenase